MLSYYWKDTCLLSPPRGPLRLDFYSLRLLPARVKGSGQECPLYTSQSSGRTTNPPGAPLLADKATMIGRAWRITNVTPNHR